MNKLNKQFLMTSTFLVLLSGAMVPNAYADITKCKDASGQITYSDTACVNAVAIAHIAESAATDNAADTSSRVPVTPMIDSPIVRESPWAHMNSVPPRRSTDKETISQARESLRATDRALAALHSHTMVSSR